MGIPTDVPLTGCRYHVFGMPGEERPKRIRRSQEIAAVKTRLRCKKREHKCQLPGDRERDAGVRVDQIHCVKYYQ